jgi:FkbM family methyltransferase
MKIIKQIIVNIIHFLGYDATRISKDYNRNFLGLNNLPIKSIIDIGANRGQFAREAIKVFPNAHIYCFEPGEKAYRDLIKWADAQNGKVTVYKIALGEEEKDLTFYEYSDNDEGSSFLKIVNPVSLKTTTMHQVTLDSFISQSSLLLEPEILIKIDTQGYDDRVIKGAQQILSKSLACIVEVIYDREYQDQGSFKSIFSLLNESGFEFMGNKEQHLSRNGNLMWSDSVFIKNK